MEENKVIMPLTDYMELIEKQNKLKFKLESKENNYDRMVEYFKEELKSNETYHIGSIINNDKFSIKNSLNIKLKDYQYECLVNTMIKVGITLDLIEKIVDSAITEYKEATLTKEKAKNE